ncbi:hypothetical protein CRG98_024585 [Punica granatum]|uniref:Uncharacterized protein n=1 Tax=Punica granatum TaxID=22663 RepID=A0A2I0JGI6_PUNGR|nr:hypothetical protein CRG98_024585 [Punica granatum]
MPSTDPVSNPFWPTGFPHGDSRPNPGKLFITRQPEANRCAQGHEQWEKSWVTEKRGKAIRRIDERGIPKMMGLALWHYSSPSHRITERCPIWGFKNPPQCQSDQRDVRAHFRGILLKSGHPDPARTPFLTELPSGRERLPTSLQVFPRKAETTTISEYLTIIPKHLNAFGAH